MPKFRIIRMESSKGAVYAIQERRFPFLWSTLQTQVSFGMTGVHISADQIFHSHRAAKEQLQEVKANHKLRKEVVIHG